MSAQLRNCEQCGEPFYPHYYDDELCHSCWEHQPAPYKPHWYEWFPLHEMIFFTVCFVFGFAVAKIFF